MAARLLQGKQAAGKRTLAVFQPFRRGLQQKAANAVQKALEAAAEVVGVAVAAAAEEEAGTAETFGQRQAGRQQARGAQRVPAVGDLA